MSSIRFPEDASGKLFDTIMKDFQLRNDAELAAFTGINGTKISKIRNNHTGLSAADREAVQLSTKYDLEKVLRLIKGK